MIILQSLFGIESTEFVKAFMVVYGELALVGTKKIISMEGVYLVCQGIAGVQPVIDSTSNNFF